MDKSNTHPEEHKPTSLKSEIFFSEIKSIIKIEKIKVRKESVNNII